MLQLVPAYKKLAASKLTASIRMRQRGRMPKGFTLVLPDVRDTTLLACRKHQKSGSLVTGVSDKAYISCQWPSQPPMLVPRAHRVTSVISHHVH